MSDLNEWDNGGSLDERLKAVQLAKAELELERLRSRRRAAAMLVTLPVTLGAGLSRLLMHVVRWGRRWAVTLLSAAIACAVLWWGLLYWRNQEKSLLMVEAQRLAETQCASEREKYVALPCDDQPSDPYSRMVQQSNCTIALLRLGACQARIREKLEAEQQRGAVLVALDELLGV